MGVCEAGGRLIDNGLPYRKSTYLEPSLNQDRDCKEIKNKHLFKLIHGHCYKSITIRCSVSKNNQLLVNWVIRNADVIERLIYNLAKPMRNSDF